MNPDKTFSNLEQDLDQLFTLPEPDKAFMAALQKSLASPNPRPRRTIIQPLNWPRALIAVAVALALVMILVIGPQRAWAMTVDWLRGGTGFNTNVGFAPADATLELAHPVEISRGSAVFEMGNVLFIHGKETHLNYAIQLSPEIYSALAQYSNLPPEDGQTFGESMPPYKFQTFNNWIRTPEGKRLSTLGGMVYLQDGRLFSVQGYAEPGENLYTRYELVLPAKLAEIIGAGDGDWVIPFDLKPVEMIRPPATANPAQPAREATATLQTSGSVYQPTLEAAKVDHIDVQLTDVAITAQETAIRLSLSDQKINLRRAGFDSEKIHLEDEMGNQYARIEKDAPEDEGNPFQKTLFFEPLKPGVKQIKVTVDALIVMNSSLLDCPAQTPICDRRGLEYTIQADEGIQPGMTLTPQQKLELPGFPGHTLTLERVEIRPGDDEHSALQIRADWQYNGSPAMKLVSVVGNIMRKPEEPMGGYGGVSHSGIPIGNNQIRETYVLNQDTTSSTVQALYLNVGVWEVDLTGPWVLSWEIPEK